MPKLFVELAHQRLFGGLARLALAAREFPQARHVTGFGTAGQQDAPAGVGDHAGNDVNGSKRIRHGDKSAASERCSAMQPGLRIWDSLTQALHQRYQLPITHSQSAPQRSRPKPHSPA